MSHFIIGSHDRLQDIDSLASILLNLYPSVVSTTNINNNLLSLRNYQQTKPIDDIVLHHRKNHSWLLLTGTPLISLDKDDQQKLTEDIFKDPKRAILDNIDGHFLIIGYHSQHQKLIVASDLNCFVPVFYFYSTNGWLFCSSELALAKLLRAETDDLGVSQAINLGTTWNDITRFRNISKIKAGEIITIDRNNRLSKERYWRPKDEEIWTDQFDEVLESWISLLRDGMLSFFKTAKNKTVTVNITAGEDSRLLVALCQSLKLPYETIVSGFSDDVDVVVAKKAAHRAGFPLKVNLFSQINKEELLSNALNICLQEEGYGSFFRACLSSTGKRQRDPNRFSQLHFSGVPGGEAFRGTYYNRAKLVFSSKTGHFDYKPFTKLKFLLDHYVGLLQYPDADFLSVVYESTRDSLREVDEFSDGIQVDHLLREFQTCTWSLSKRQPFYLPLGLKHLTRSIYSIPPHFKRGGKLTKACTEMLFPRLARIKTQHGVPTVRKTLMRQPLFLPEYFSEAKRVTNGFMRRYLHVRQSSRTLSKQHNINYHSQTMQMLLNNKPYDDWLKSAGTMITGSSYNGKILDEMLAEARQGRCRYIQVLGRVINHELVCRYIYDL